MGRTTKPCPGCKNVNSARSADGVCMACEQLMADGRAYRDRIATEMAKKKMEVVILPWQYYSLPYLGYRTESEPLQRAFLELAKLVSAPNITNNWKTTKPLIPKQEDGRHDDGAAVRLFQSEIVAALRALYAGLHPLIKAAEAAGHHAGSSLITRLATGEVSVDEFNEATIADPRKRDSL